MFILILRGLVLVNVFWFLILLIWGVVFLIFLGLLLWELRGLKRLIGGVVEVGVMLMVLLMLECMFILLLLLLEFILLVVLVFYGLLSRELVLLLLLNGLNVVLRVCF